MAVENVGNGVRLRFTGIPGQACSLERAVAFIGPWSILNIQTAPASGVLEYTDAHPTADTGFYRTVLP